MVSTAVQVCFWIFRAVTPSFLAGVVTTYTVSKLRRPQQNSDNRTGIWMFLQKLTHLVYYILFIPTVLLLSRMSEWFGLCCCRLRQSSWERPAGRSRISDDTRWVYFAIRSILTALWFIFSLSSSDGCEVDVLYVRSYRGGLQLKVHSYWSQLHAITNQLNSMKKSPWEANIIQSIKNFSAFNQSTGYNAVFTRTATVFYSAPDRY